MSKFEHRRKDLAGGAPDDPDWVTTHTVPGLSRDVEAGDIRPLSPASSSLLVSAELVDVGGVPLDPTGITMNIVMVSRARVGSINVMDAGVEQVAVPLQRRHIELHVAKGVQHWVRITNIVGAPATGTIRIYAAEDVKT